MLFLAQSQEILAQLVFVQRGRIALEMCRQFADVSHVLFLGRLAIIFKLDEVLELSDRGIGYMHRPGSMRPCGRNFPAKVSSATPWPKTPPRPCCEAAQFNEAKVEAD